MTSREEALERIAALAREHGLTPDEVSARLRPPAEARPAMHGRSGLLGRILAYLGGIFVFAGVGVFTALNWDGMNAAARIIISLGSGIAAFVMAAVAARDDRYEKAATPLFLIAAALQPTGILVTIDEFSSDGDWRHAVLVTTGIMLVQQGAMFWKTHRKTLLFTTIAFSLWLFGTALDLLGMDWDWIALLLGASTVGLCTGLEKTPYREVTPPWYLAGAAGFYAGLFGLVEDSAIDLLFLLAACGGLFLSVYVRRRTLLIVTTIAILCFVSYYTSRHFADSLGWPILLIVLGLVLLLLSAMALKINRRYFESA